LSWLRRQRKKPATAWLSREIAAPNQHAGKHSAAPAQRQSIDARDAHRENKLVAVFFANRRLAV
jgi:hypothetical protein